MQKYKSVRTDEQIRCCLINDLEVDVWFQEELELTGRIEEFNDEIIKFSEGYFIRENVKVFVRENLLRDMNTL